MIIGKAITAGGSGGIKCKLNITTSPGAAVTATLGEKVVEAVAGESGKAILELSKEGIWTVTATHDGETVSKEVDTSLSVTANLIFVDPILENNSWETISEIAKKGEAQNYWSIGDTKSVVVNGTFGSVSLSNVTYYAFILGFNHNEAIEGKGIHFGCFKTSAGVDIVFNGFAMYSSQTNYDGWGGSLMRNSYCPAFLACLPAELQEVITECPKYTDNMGGTSTNAVYVTATNDKIFIPAEWEVYGTRTYAHTAEQNYQKQYDYFAAGNSTIRYNHSAVSSACQWWLRSPLKNSSSNSFVMSYTNGKVSGTASNSAIGFFPCFKV